MKRTSKTGIVLAAAAAALFATGCSSLCGEPSEPMVKCALNMKGHPEHYTPSNAGKGYDDHDAGWTYMTKSECMAHGGTILD